MLAGQSIRFASTQVVKVPLQLHGIHGRYATALYTSAVKSNKIDVIDNDIQRIKQTLKSHPSLTTFLETPIIDKKVKIEGLKEILKSSKVAPETTNFFTLLAENMRLDQTSKIINGFEELLLAHRGNVTVTVTSAKVLDPKALGKIVSCIEKSTLISKGEKIRIVEKIEPEILGGFIVEVGDRTVDLSVSSRVNKLNQLLTTSV